MGMMDLFLDLTLGSWAGDKYRFEKSKKNLARLLAEEEYKKNREEERRHQELLQGIQGKNKR